MMKQNATWVNTNGIEDKWLEAGRCWDNYRNILYILQERPREFKKDLSINFCLIKAPLLAFDNGIQILERWNLMILQKNRYYME